MDSEKTGVQVEKLPAVLTLARAAEVAGVSRRTLRRWIKAGLLDAGRPVRNGSSPVRIDARSLMKLLGVKVAE